MSAVRGTAANGLNTLVDFAYENIRKDITEEFLHGGEKVNVNLLCDRYGISPTPLKQALNRLMVEGLVDGIPRRGYRVRRVNLQELQELFDLRLMMELYFTPQVAAAVSGSTVLQRKFEKNLKENLSLAQNFTTAEEYFRIYEMDQQFHELYIISSGSQSALRTYKGLNTHTYAAYLFGKQPKGKTVEGIEEHREIYEALCRGDVAETRSHLTRHNENARGKIQLAITLNSIPDA